MSTDYRAIAVIGINIDLSKIPTEDTWVKVGKHNRPKTMKFDPDTGVRLWNVISCPKFQFHRHDYSLGELEIPFIDFPDEMHIELFDSGGQKTQTILGFGIISGTWEQPVLKCPYHLPAIENIKQELKNKLECVGLWDEKEFGLWAILQIT
jgi:hypothetical protein